ncbi:MAG: PQQ-binding-like beta-propeller repeat protein, partial [Planctomycetota bacterium]
LIWRFPAGSYTGGTGAVENGRLYICAPSSRRLYCVNAVTGAEIWHFPTGTTAGGGVAIRDDGVIYVNASGGSGWLFAVSPDGQELWRYPLVNQGLNAAPMIDGAGTAYFCTYRGNTQGWVHAVNRDGTPLWVKEMPDMVAATPMLAPDGTLYVMCQDKYLYAFHDHMKGDLNCDFWVNFDDINPFVQLLADPAGWQAAHPECPMSNGDCNGDGQVNFDDINPFVALLAH